MGLAGSLVFGIDMKKVTTQDSDKNDVSIYQNYLDGPNAAISLGNGAIKLESNVNKTNGIPTVTIGAKDNGAKAKIYLAGYEIVGNINQSFSASFKMGHGNGNDQDASEKYDTVTVESGDSAGTSNKVTNTIKWLRYSITAGTTYKINQSLN